MSTSINLPPGAEIAHLPQPLRLECGEELRGVFVGYEILGPEHAPLVLVQGGISSGRHLAAHESDKAPGWWEGCVAPGGPIDSKRFRVLALDYLGGNGLTTQPQLCERVEHAGLGFPEVSTYDQAKLTALLLDELGVSELHAFVGASYGAMVALAFAERYPERVGSILAISGAHQAHPMGVAWRSLQRRVLRLALENALPGEALSIARGMEMVSSRSPEDLARRFGGKPREGGPRSPWPVESYLEACGRDYVEGFRPEPFYVLSRAMDLHRVVPEQIFVPATLVSVSSDQLVPSSQVAELASRMAGPVRHIEVESLLGHEAYLSEFESFAVLLREALDA